MDGSTRIWRATHAAAIAALALAAAGCAAGSVWGLALGAVLSVGALTLSGCGSSHDRDDMEEEGTWSECCVDGTIDTCYCPPMTACNYGWFTDCGGGMCETGPDACGEGDGGAPDAGPADAGGTWEPCCVDGVVDTCFCPGGAECNYGWFDDCGDGTCANPPDMCGAPDAGPVDAGADAGPADAGPADAGGRWEPCCVDGMIDTCYCPPMTACNYGWFTDCGGGTCAFGPDACPDAGMAP